MTNRLAFLCRGSASVGLGHVMRSRAVAEAACAHAHVSCAVIGDESVDPLIEERSSLKIRRYRREADAVRATLAGAPDAVFLDTTDLTDAHFASLAAAATMVSLSPVFRHLERCDRVYHRTQHHPLAPRCGWRHGLEYAVIRPEVQRIAAAQYRASIDPSAVLSIAISMGGGDATNRTLRVLERLRHLPGRMLFWVLLGEGYGHSFDALIECARRNRRHEVILARTTDSMWRVMNGCAVAVLASGTVTYESAAAGLPSVNMLEHSSQRYLLQELIDAGVARGVEGAFDLMIEQVAQFLQDVDADRSVLEAMHAASEGLIDGQAAQRIVRDVLAALDGDADISVMRKRTEAPV